MLVIQHAKPEDLRFISEIHAYCWRETYSFMPNTVLNQRNQEYRLQQWSEWLSNPGEKEALFAVKHNGKVVGFCFCCPNADSDLSAKGELHAAYVLPAYRGGEVGPLMMFMMVTFMQYCGFDSLGLWAFKENAVRYWYAQMGWKASIHRDRHIAGEDLPEVGYVCNELDKLCAKLARQLSRHSYPVDLLQNQLRSPQKHYPAVPAGTDPQSAHIVQ